MRITILAAILLAGCATKEIKTIGTVERKDASLNNLIDEGATIEVLGEGYTWSEGPVWSEKENMLLFSDVPENIIYKWSEAKGVEPYLKQSGFTGTSTDSREPGSNGLIIYNDSLILSQHGNRQLARMNAALSTPTADYISIATMYNGKRFSSPNDVAVRNGAFFFTDPPYGLKELDNDPAKETPINGVYKAEAGVVSLLVDTLTKPNGIAFMPGMKKFVVANSDPKKAIWYEFELNEKDSVTNARIFYDATRHTATEKGLPDGLKIDSKGNVFATGPGGVWIFDSTGKELGKIKLSEASANCALSPDEKTLYITADMYLLRIKMRQ